MWERLSGPRFDGIANRASIAPGRYARSEPNVMWLRTETMKRCGQISAGLDFAKKENAGFNAATSAGGACRWPTWRSEPHQCFRRCLSNVIEQMPERDYEHCWHIC